MRRSAVVIAGPCETADWRTRFPDGRLPAPPHDQSGHTWHHADRILFEITKYAVPKGASRLAASNMPAFSQTITDEEIWAVLSYIKSKWPAGIRARHDRINRHSRLSR